MSEYEVWLNVRVKVTVTDPDVIERVTGPEGDEWRASMYQLHTTGDVLEMFADNCVRRGITDVSRLDGWADLPEGAATAELLSVGLDDVEALS